MVDVCEDYIVLLSSVIGWKYGLKDTGLAGGRTCCVERVYSILGLVMEEGIV